MHEKKYLHNKTIALESVCLNPFWNHISTGFSSEEFLGDIKKAHVFCRGHFPFEASRRATEIRPGE